MDLQDLCKFHGMKKIKIEFFCLSTVLLQGWPWHWITHKGWYVIKQRNQTNQKRQTSELWVHLMRKKFFLLSLYILLFFGASVCVYIAQPNQCNHIHLIHRYSQKHTSPVVWGCRIHFHLFREVRTSSFPSECPEFDTKPSDGEVPVLELWGM